MDFNSFCRAVSECGVVAASNAKVAAPKGRRPRKAVDVVPVEALTEDVQSATLNDAECVEAVRRGRIMAARVLDALKDDHGILEKAAVEMAWLGVLR